MGSLRRGWPGEGGCDARTCAAFKVDAPDAARGIAFEEIALPVSRAVGRRAVGHEKLIAEDRELGNASQFLGRAVTTAAKAPTLDDDLASGEGDGQPVVADRRECDDLCLVITPPLPRPTVIEGVDDIARYRDELPARYDKAVDIREWESQGRFIERSVGPQRAIKRRNGNRRFAPAEDIIKRAPESADQACPQYDLGPVHAASTRSSMSRPTRLLRMPPI